MVVMTGGSPKETTIAARLGDIIYWIGCLLAVSWAAPCCYTAHTHPGVAIHSVLFAIIGAAIIWVFCRAVQYVLASR